MKNFLIDCDYVMDIVYEADKDISLPLLTQVRIDLHIFFCENCARELKNLQTAEDIMKTDFFPPAPELGNIIMERLGDEACEEETVNAPAGFSFRSWVIIGFFLLLSLASSFFGMNFIGIANSEGSSFLLPLGITIGIIVTCYGALFIGSHLKELSSRFGLR